jgi:hypothetical protein
MIRRTLLLRRSIATVVGADGLPSKPNMGHRSMQPLGQLALPSGDNARDRSWPALARSRMLGPAEPGASPNGLEASDRAEACRVSTHLGHYR